MTHTDINLNIAEVFVRCFLGILFIFQGYDKLFVLKIKNVVSTFQNEASEKNVPKFLITLTSYFTSITEFFGGILLVTGLFHEIVIILLALNLLVVGVAFSFMNPIWDLKHVFPRVILLTIVLVLSHYFRFGLDAFIFN
jgi:putative oxidoreductase